MLPADLPGMNLPGASFGDSSAESGTGNFMSNFGGLSRNAPDIFGGRSVLDNANGTRNPWILILGGGVLIITAAVAYKVVTK